MGVFGTWTFDDLRRQVGVPLEMLLPALFRLVQDDPSLDRSAIVNPGCSPAELDATEVRIGFALHPLHRLLLSLSNGGTLPCSGRISVLAAAVPRETEWRIVGPFLTAEERATFQVLVDRLLHPVKPWVLGSLPSIFDEGLEVAEPYIDDLVIFADGFGDECWGYVRGDSARIACYYQVPGGGLFPESKDFEEFLLHQPLYPRLQTAAFVERVRAALPCDEQQGFRPSG
ncbi:MAG TPA: hypothetical protein VFS83_14450 [Ktedonobacterales bacterium]|nr:hypothetical protein [Ktedonobacterales bacterium]